MAYRSPRFGLLCAALVVAAHAGCDGSSKPAPGKPPPGSNPDGGGAGVTTGPTTGPKTVDVIVGQPVTFRPDLELTEVEFGGGRFVAVGAKGTLDVTNQVGYALGARALVLTSVDGRSWTEVWAGDSAVLDDVAFSDGRWMAVGGRLWAWVDAGQSGQAPAQLARGDMVVVSDDGESWGATASTPPERLTAVVPGGSGFVALAPDAAVSAGLSTAGVSWTRRSIPPTTYGFDSLARSGDILLAFSLYGDVARSVDEGRTWAPVEMPSEDGSGGRDNIQALWATAEGWAGTSQYGGRWFLDLASPDGVTWTRVRREDSDRALAPLQVVRGGGVDLRRVRAAGGDGIEVAGADGSWTRTLAPPLGDHLAGLAYGNGVFVAVGQRNLHWSADGKTWTAGAVVAGP